ncbi:MFS transporter [Paenibacillus sp. TRM 82003]|nr:MFS transporter [Paenibacillus sp. TRM 82003]
MLLAVVFFGYLAFGVSENIKGPAFPRIQEDFGISELQIGFVLSLNSVGFLLAASFSGLLVNRIGLRAACFLAFGGMAVSGVLLGGSNAYLPFAASFFVLNLWNGLLEISLALLSARIFTKNTGLMMNLSHFFYGLSSTGAPLAATYLMGWSFTGGNPLGWQGMFVVMMALCLVPALPVAAAKFPPAANGGADAPSSWRMYAKDPIAWYVVIVLSLGVTAELAVGGWLVIYLEKMYSWSNARASGMLAAFFLCFMLARLLLGAVTDKLGYVRSIVLFSALSGLCTCAAVLAGEPAAFLFALSGAGIAMVYPTLMAFVARRFEGRSDAAITFTVTMVGLFGIAGNLLIGAVVEWFGYHAGYLTIGACALLCAAGGVLLQRRIQLGAKGA